MRRSRYEGWPARPVTVWVPSALWEDAQGMRKQVGSYVYELVTVGLYHLLRELDATAVDESVERLTARIDRQVELAKQMGRWHAGEEPDEAGD